MSGMDMTDEVRASDETLQSWAALPQSCLFSSIARELLAHRRASQVAPAPSDGLREAAQWANAAMVAIRGYERDLGVPMDDECEIGRIDDSRDSPSFRIRVWHIRRIAQALSASPAQEGEPRHD